MTEIEQALALAEIEVLKQQIEMQEHAYSQDLEEGLHEAYQVDLEERVKYEATIASLEHQLETLEVKLYNEYEVMLKEQKDFMIGKVDKYLASELGKMLNYFPEHADMINQWHDAHPAAVVVEQAINQVEIE